MAYNRHGIVRWLESNGFALERRAGGHAIFFRGAARVTLQAHGKTDMDANVLAAVVRNVSDATGIPRAELKRAWR